MQAMPTEKTPLLLAPTPMDRIRRIANLMRGMVVIGGTVFVASTLFLWFSHQWVEIVAMRDVGVDAASISLTPAAQWVSALAALVPLSVGVFGMFQVWKLFGAYAQGHIFTSQASTRLRRLAWSLIVCAAAQVLSRTATSIALTFNNPPGKKMLIVNISSTDYTFVLFGVLLLGIAWVMVEATRLAQENAEFI